MVEIKSSGGKIFIDNTVLEKQQAMLFLEAFRKMKEHLIKNPEEKGVRKIVVDNKMFDFNIGGKIGVASVFAEEILTRDELDALEENEIMLK